MGDLCSVNSYRKQPSRPSPLVRQAWEWTFSVSLLLFKVIQRIVATDLPKLEYLGDFSTDLAK